MIDEKSNILKICPKFGTCNLIGKEHMVSFVLHYYQNPVIIDKGDQTSTKLSFYYQILDFRNTSLIHATRPPRKELVNLGMERTLQLEPFRGTFQNLSNPRLELVLKVLHALVFAFAINLVNFLTPVIYRNNFTCNIPEAEAIFYDGPVQVLWQPALPILGYCGCLQNTINNTTTKRDDEEVRGSIGELNIVFFVPMRNGNNSTHLEITWQAHLLQSNVLRIREVNLNFSGSTTIDFHPVTTTLFDVHIQAPDSKFIQLTFTDINYVASSDDHLNVYFKTCLDGFEITSDLVHGQICSNSTAEILLTHYKTDGLVVGRNITLIKKQYGWLLPASAVITASPHSCVGYVNVLPNRKNFASHFRIPRAIVRFGIT